MDPGYNPYGTLCPGSLDSECGPDIQVQDQSARFESVMPDWQGRLGFRDT